MKGRRLLAEILSEETEIENYVWLWLFRKALNRRIEIIC